MKIEIFILIILISIIIFSNELFDYDDFLIISSSKAIPGSIEKIYPVSLKPISQNQTLIFLKKAKIKDNLILNEKEISKAIKENQIVKPEKDFDYSEEYLISIIDKRGKIILENETEFEFDIKKGRGSAQVLVMDETDACPYAYVDKNSKILYCYDLSLNEKKKYEIPLHELNDLKVTFNGKVHIIYFFGREYLSKLSNEQKKDFRNQGPMEYKKVGCKFTVEKEKWDVLPFTLEDLYNSISKIVRNENGDKVIIDKRFIDIKVIDDLKNCDGFDVLIIASEVKDAKKRFEFSGNTYFFKAYIDNLGLGSISQLKFFIHHEKRDEIKEDKEKGILYFPEAMEGIKDYMKLFKIAENDLLMYLSTRVALLNAIEEQLSDSYDIYRYFIYFSDPKVMPYIYSYEDISSQLEEKAKNSDFKIIPIFGLRDRIEKYNFLFDSICVDKRDKQKNFPCLLKATFQMP